MSSRDPNHDAVALGDVLRNLADAELGDSPVVDTGDLVAVRKRATQLRRRRRAAKAIVGVLAVCLLATTATLVFRGVQRSEPSFANATCPPGLVCIESGGVFAFANGAIWRDGGSIVRYEATVTVRNVGTETLEGIEVSGVSGTDGANTIQGSVESVDPVVGTLDPGDEMEFSVSGSAASKIAVGKKARLLVQLAKSGTELGRQIETPSITVGASRPPDA